MECQERVNKTMDLEYLKELYETNKEVFLESEYILYSYVDLLNYILDLISCNMLLDYGVDIDLYNLFRIKKEE